MKLGRAQSNDIVCDDSKASRFHGEFKVEAGQLTYRDLESTNGTKINGEIVPPFMWQILTEGNTIQIGDWSAAVQVSHTQISRSAKNEHKIPRPTVDPAGPQANSELTRERSIPEGLSKK